MKTSFGRSFVIKTKLNKQSYKKRRKKIMDFNRKFNDAYNDAGSGFALVGVIAFAFLIIFILPWLSFWIAYFMGWIAKITIGKMLVNGFALVGLTIPLDKIPLLAGAIGWISSFFGGTRALSKSNN